jgi:hypothetical protein
MVFQMYGSQDTEPARNVVRLSGVGTLAEPSRGLWQAWVGLTLEAVRGSSDGGDKGHVQSMNRESSPTRQNGSNRPQLLTVPSADVW